MRDGDGGSLGPPKAYHIPSMPTTDPVAGAYDRERRRKMFALTKAAFPDLKVPMPFVSVRAKKETGFSMPFVRASVIVKPYDDDEEDKMPPKDVFDDAWCLWDTGAQSIMILTRMLSPEVRGGEELQLLSSMYHLFNHLWLTVDVSLGSLGLSK